MRLSVDALTSTHLAFRPGPAGTRTPLHTDVAGTFSWSLSLAGRKRWCLWAPAQAARLFPLSGAHLPPWPADASPLLCPLLPAPCAVFVQQPGTCVFVPSCWPHTVENLDDCLSVSCNWANAHSLPWLLSAAAVDRSLPACELLAVCSLAAESELARADDDAAAVAVGALERTLALRRLGHVLATLGDGQGHAALGACCRGAAEEAEAAAAKAGPEFDAGGDVTLQRAVGPGRVTRAARRVYTR